MHPEPPAPPTRHCSRNHSVRLELCGYTYCFHWSWSRLSFRAQDLMRRPTLSSSEWKEPIVPRGHCKPHFSNAIWRMAGKYNLMPESLTLADPAECAGNINSLNETY